MPPAHNLTSWSPYHITFICLFPRYKGEDIWLLQEIEAGLPWWKLTATTTMLPISIVSQLWQLIWSYYHSPGLTLDIFPFPVAAQDIFLCPTMPQDFPKSIYKIPTIESSRDMPTLPFWVGVSRFHWQFSSPTRFPKSYQNLPLFLKQLLKIFKYYFCWYFCLIFFVNTLHRMS